MIWLIFQKSNFCFQIWTIDSFHQTNQNQLFGALVMRVLQPTNLNTIEPVILKVRPVELNPVNPDGVRRWHWLWSACSISSFHLVHLSGKRRSELALTWYYNTTSAEKGWFLNSQWEFRIFSGSDWMMKIQIQCWKIESAPVTSPDSFE